MSGYANAMPSTNFDNAHVRAVTLVSVTTDDVPGTTAKATFAFTIPPTYSNNLVGGGETHGGAVATFLDNLTSAALMASKRYWGQGMSRSMNVTYLHTPREGQRCVVEAEVVHFGRTMATVLGRMSRESDGVLLAVCTHEKVRVDGEGKKGNEAFYAKLS